MPQRKRPMVEPVVFTPDADAVATRGLSSDSGVAPVDGKLAEAEPLGRRLPPGAYLNHFVEEPSCRLVERLARVEHAADVEVDVVVHRDRRACVPGDLDDGRDRVARRRA